ncbi:hypothetical protein L21SP5_00183 [Salinivirga cyanobacteriivorans]|uniref:Uncharacterized protein n=1 Tax=Salinivirga cyanobacteriivorans TaxID=1307839 RepID=A0A0S2HV32_9BACT|nr:DUF6402 family protein [Salinivirga cyanobacteriivorans]ALO13854.1 hypothetical protein L21SP5_00174 [Salinivirga cyanobacteriivorans]ALO13863.1 hypothetical protein L21SP5_00183 [Salinivirga cyanobacteriivorans]
MEEGEYVGDDSYVEAQEILRLLRLVYTENIDFNFPDKNISADDVVIGNNTYAEVEIVSIDTQTEAIEVNGNTLKYSSFDIITQSESDANKLREFISGEEENIYGTSPETQVSLTINGSVVSFNHIVQNVKNRYLYLLNSGKYNELSEAEKTILDIPIIQWKLGYPYGAAFIDHWFESEGADIHLTDENFEDLFEASSIFQEVFNDASNNKIIYPYNTGPLGETLTELCDRISQYATEGQEQLTLGLWPDYQENTGNINRFYSESATQVDLISGLSFVDEDLAYAIGRFTISFYFDAVLNILGFDRAVGEGDIYFRVWDSFDFEGVQPLGSWERDVFNCEAPTIGFEMITNSDFLPLYEKLNDEVSAQEVEFDIITKYYKIDGNWLLDYSSNSTNCNLTIDEED